MDLSFSNLLTEMANVVNDTAEAQLKQNLCLRQFLKTKTEYRVRESQAFLQMQSLVRKVESECKEKKVKLDQKKEKESGSKADELDRGAKEKDGMFPKETLELKKLTDECNYYVEQMYTEVSRVLADNCKIMDMEFRTMLGLL
jgi:hypothetical protein